MSEDTLPKFFIPGCAIDEQETVYAAMARGLPNVAVPDLGERLYEISHIHDEDVWFAKVGSTLTGLRPIINGRKKSGETTPIEDSAMVLAIFPSSVDDLCFVSTDGRGRKFQAPYYLGGKVGRRVYFSR